MTAGLPATLGVTAIRVVPSRADAGEPPPVHGALSLRLYPQLGSGDGHVTRAQATNKLEPFLISKPEPSPSFLGRGPIGTL